MFSGIVENLGTIRNIIKNDNGFKIEVEFKPITHEVVLGDSIAINGVCLTIENINNSNFVFSLSPETLDVTCLDTLSINDKVNIEYPLTLNKFISGHITSGHIDSFGIITDIAKTNESWNFHITINNSIKKFIIKKGSIAIDGVSLTINDIKDNILDLMIIPHTYKNTIMQHYKIGDKVNIETDYIIKHLEHLKND